MWWLELSPWAHGMGWASPFPAGCAPRTEQGGGIVGQTKGQRDLSAGDGRNVLKDQKSKEIGAAPSPHLDGNPSPVEPKQGKAGNWERRELPSSGWCHLMWRCQTCSRLSQHLPQHLRGPGRRVGIAQGKAHPGLSGIRRNKARGPREKGMESQRDLTQSIWIQPGAEQRTPEPMIHTTPSSHIPNFAEFSQNSPSPSLRMSRELLGNAGSGNSGFGAHPHLLPAARGRSGAAGGAVQGGDPRSGPAGVPGGPPPTPGCRSLSPPSPTPTHSRRQRAPRTRAGGGPGRPLPLFGVSPLSGRGHLPSGRPPDAPNPGGKRLEGRRAAAVAAAIAIGGGERGCFPSAADPEGFGSPREGS